MFSERNKNLYRYLVLLCFTSFHFVDITFFFNKLKVCGNPASSNPIGTIFPTVFFFSHSVYVSYFCNFHNVSNFEKKFIEV